MYQEAELNLGSLITEKHKEFKRHKIQDGDNFYRILPPFGTNHGGSVCAEWYLHWGFTDKLGKMRPLVCTKRNERYCPICEQANILYQEKENLVADYMDADKHITWQRVPEDIKAKHKTIGDMFSKVKASRYYYYNAVDQGGTVGVLALPKTAKELLNAKILEAVQKYGFNPVSLATGCFFVIRRVKTGASIRDIEYQVDFMRQTVQSAEGILEKIVQGPLPATITENFEKLAYDLHTLYVVRNSERVKRILNGDSSAFDEDEKPAVAQKDDVDAPKAAPVLQPQTMIPQPGIPNVLTPSQPAVITVPPITQPVSVQNQPAHKDVSDIDNLKKLLGY